LEEEDELSLEKKLKILTGRRTGVVVVVIGVTRMNFIE
jgi:hypothetical protein